MKKLNLFVLIISLILILTTGTICFYFFYNYYEVREMPLFLEVQKGVLGLNADRDALNFGKIMPGNSGKRFLEIGFDKKAQVIIVPEGELAEWITVSPSNLMLEPGDKKEVTLTANVPGSAEERKYTGKIKLYFKRT